MKKTLAIILAVLMTVSMLSVFVSAETEAVAFTGEGTAASPYLIKSVENLAYLRTQVGEGNNFAGKYFTMTNDIDLGGIEWAPIGNTGKPFSGVFDGCGYEIKNLSITTNPGLVGFFGAIFATADYEAGVANLTLSGKIKIDGIGAAIGMGGLVGWAYKDAEDGFKQIYITNVTTNIDFEITNVTNQPRCGAVAGYAFCTTFENVVNNGSFTYTGSAVARVGGIAGQTNRSTYINCVNNGNITVTNTAGNVAIAGIAPIVTYKKDDVYTNFINCINNGTITGTTGEAAVYAAGIVSNPYSGKTAYYLNVEGCANTGNISGKVASTSKFAYVGGIFGYSNKKITSINGCVNTGVITSESDAGSRAGGILSVCSNAADDTTFVFSGNTSTGKAIGWSAIDFAGKYTEEASDADAKKLVDAVKANLKPSETKIAGFDTVAKAEEPAPATGDNAVWFAVIGIVAVLGTAVAVKKVNG